MDKTVPSVAAVVPLGAFDSIEDLIVIFDANGRHSHWNRSVVETTGYDDETLSSMEPERLFADADAVRDAVEEVLESERSTFETTLLTATGDALVYEFASTAVRDPGVDARRVVGVGRDVTDARRHERERERYEIVLDTLADAVYGLADDGTIVYVNEQYAKMKGASREELVGSHIRDWVDDAVIDRAEEMREELDRGERDVATAEHEFVSLDGDRFPAEVRFGRAVRDGGDLSRVGTIRDVTERAERERTLRRQNERLDEFASIVSHDLRNPLNVAEGRLELAREECESDHLDIAADAHDRMRALIDDLLTLSRQERLVPEPTAVSLPRLARRCWDSVAGSTAALSIETDVTVRADERQLSRLLENLFRNGVEHAGADVVVTLRSLADGVAVADDGPGIPPDERDRVFETGYSTSRNGTGFGLRIVREVADAHGWDVRVTDGPDGGAQFEFRGVTVE